MTEDQQELWELIEDVRPAMMTTVEPDGTFRSRPMWTQGDDFDGSLWFFTSDEAPKVEELERNPHVGLSYAAPDKDLYVSVSGRAQLVHDEAKAKEPGTSTPRPGSRRAWTTPTWRCSASTSSGRSSGKTRSRRSSSSPRSCSAPSRASRRRAVRKGSSSSAVAPRGAWRREN